MLFEARKLYRRPKISAPSFLTSLCNICNLEALLCSQVFTRMAINLEDKLIGMFPKHKEHPVCRLPLMLFVRFSSIFIVPEYIN
jgi:hypothetical protein